MSSLSYVSRLTSHTQLPKSPPESPSESSMPHAQKSFSHKMQIILQVVAITCIVALFSMLYCWAFWDPAGNLKQVPIGIINNDEGTDINGSHINMGADIMNEALNNDELQFHELEASAIDEGLQNSGYLIVFEIPSHFSADVSAGTSGMPRVADMTVWKNTRYNYLFSQFSNQAVKSFEHMIYSQIVKGYVEGSYEGLQQAHDGMTTAAEKSADLAQGASTIAESLQSAQQGSKQAVQGTRLLADKTPALSSGATSLAQATDQASQGADSLYQGIQILSDGSNNLTEGSAQLQTALRQLADNANHLHEGATTLNQSIQNALAQNQETPHRIAAFQQSMQQVFDIGQSIDANLPKASDISGISRNSHEVYDLIVRADRYLQEENFEQAQATLKEAQDQQAHLSSQTDSLTNALSSHAATLSTFKSKLSSASQDAQTLIAHSLGTDSISSIQSATQKLEDGSQQLAQASDEIAAKSRTLTNGTQSLAQGLSDAQQGASNLSEGLTKLADRSATLATSTQTLNTSIQSLALSMPLLSNGIARVQDGTNTLSQGASTLSSSLEEGTQKLASSLTVPSAEMGDYVSAPLNVTTHTYGKLDYYGQGFAPFFMTTALWLGALLIFFIIDPFYPARNQAGRFRTVLARLPWYAVVCMLEVLAICTAAVHLGVTAAHDVSLPLFFAYAFAISLSFMLIMQFLNLTFGVIGKGLAMLLLIIQLVCAGGTLPVELGNPAIAAINPYLPFTWSIDGFREIITGGSSVALNLGIVMGMGLICMGASLLLWNIAVRMREKETAALIAQRVSKEACYV